MGLLRHLSLTVASDVPGTLTIAGREVGTRRARRHQAVRIGVRVRTRRLLPLRLTLRASGRRAVTRITVGRR